MTIAEYLYERFLDESEENYNRDYPAVSRFMAYLQELPLSAEEKCHLEGLNIDTELQIEQAAFSSGIFYAIRYMGECFKYYLVL